MYYQKILWEIYSKVDPVKRKNISEMLKRSKGKEEALLAQIANKYPSINLEEIRKKVQKDLNPPAPEPPEKRKSFPIWIPVSAGAVVVLLILWAILPGSPKKEDGLGKLYVIADWMFARSAPVVKKATKTGEKIYFGEELPVFQILENDGDKWIKSIYKLDTVYLLHRFLGTKQEKILCESIYGNKEAREQVQDSYAKRGILAFMNQTKLMGKLSEEEQIEAYGEKKNYEVWQLLGQPDYSEFNIFAEGKFSGAYFGGYPKKYPYRYLDFGVILTQANNVEIRKLLIFRNDQKAKPYQIGQFDLSPYPDHFIRTIEYDDPLLNTSFYNQKWKVTKDKPGILIGRNTYPRQEFLLIIEEGKIVKYG